MGLSKWMVSAGMLPVILLSSCADMNGSLGGGGTVAVPQFDQQEMKILNQARATGAVTGAAAGALLARNSNMGSAGGAALGLLAGLAAGEVIGQNQAAQARSVRLENQDLQTLLANTRANNNKLAEANRAYAKRIAELKKVSGEERAKLAKAELNNVDATLKRYDEVSAARQTSMTTLVKSQANELTAEVRRGDSERAKLANYRNELSKMSVAAN